MNIYVMNIKMKDMNLIYIIAIDVHVREISSETISKLWIL